MNKTPPRTLALAAALIVVLGTAFGFYVTDDGDSVPSPTPSAATTAPPAVPARLAAFDDSISNGDGASNGYPVLMAAELDARVVFDATEGGATAASFLPGGRHAFSSVGLAMANPDLVIIAVGSAEYLGNSASPRVYQTQLDTLTTKVCDHVKGRVLLVHMYKLDAAALRPLYPDVIPPGPRSPWTEYGTAMERSATAHGVGYLDLADAKVSISRDAVHPDDAGQATLAQLVTAGIARASACGGAR
ncbi:MAG: SGNH/GDSL hydrolase family protein [Pseudonocardiaceae bacterium]